MISENQLRVPNSHTLTVEKFMLENYQKEGCYDYIDIEEGSLLDNYTIYIDKNETYKIDEKFKEYITENSYDFEIEDIIDLIEHPNCEQIEIKECYATAWTSDYIITFKQEDNVRRKEDYNINDNKLVRSRWNPTLQKEEIPYKYDKKYKAYINLSNKLTYKQLKNREYKGLVEYFQKKFDKKNYNAYNNIDHKIKEKKMNTAQKNQFKELYNLIDGDLDIFKCIYKKTYECTEKEYDQMIQKLWNHKQLEGWEPNYNYDMNFCSIFDTLDYNEKKLVLEYINQYELYIYISENGHGLMFTDAIV